MADKIVTEPIEVFAIAPITRGEGGHERKGLEQV